jgi:lipopolysaccharide/colanic/teichoic acid biosynthesis glycosyltransferase
MLIRICDIIFSLIAIFLLLPILLPISLFLRLTGEGEIFYDQERIGKDEKTFYVKKFATMLKDSPNLGSGTITIKNDPRVLPFGKFLRKTKINELPQLINILKGDMSFIGPRPLTKQTFHAYSRDVQKKITIVKPGLSGVASIVFRDEEVLLDSADNSAKFYHSIIAPYKGELEVWFIANISLSRYFILILLTIYVVIFPKTNIIWRIFPDMPLPPVELARLK